MGKILLDNLTISRLPIARKYYKNDLNIQNYLYSLILWDKIICVDEEGFLEYSSYNRRRNYDIFVKKGMSGSVQYKRKTFLEILRNGFYNSENDIYNNLEIDNIEIDTYEYRKESYKIVENMEIMNKDKQIAEDAIRYILLGYNLGVNICLSSERTNFIYLNYYADYFFNRLSVIEMLEKDVKEFYEEINKKIGKKVICFQSPLLLDYICRESKTFQQALYMAKKIKNEKHLIEYRKTMDNMEKCLNEGNFIKFNEYISAIPDIVNSIRKSGVNTQTFEMGLNPVPNISTSVNVSFGRRTYNKLHLRFLKDLAKFGMMDRVYRI